VEFVERDVSDPAVADEMLGWTDGRLGTPVVVVGDQVVRGFDRGKLSRLLGLSP